MTDQNHHAHHETYSQHIQHNHSSSQQTLPACEGLDLSISWRTQPAQVASISRCTLLL
jgi:hypothetical protein